MATELTPTSYVVLGLVAAHGPTTPYELKAVVAESIGNFWSFPHSQLYAEPVRLARLGLLEETQEQVGRRRKRYTITPPGNAALQAWLAEPSAARVEVRDQGLLQLAFAEQAGADVGALARAQLAAHRDKTDDYARIRRMLGEAGGTSTVSPLRMGELYEQAALRFWSEVLDAAETNHGDQT